MIFTYKLVQRNHSNPPFMNFGIFKSFIFSHFIVRLGLGLYAAFMLVTPTFVRHFPVSNRFRILNQPRGFCDDLVFYLLVLALSFAQLHQPLPSRVPHSSSILMKLSSTLYTLAFITYCIIKRNPLMGYRCIFITNRQQKGIGLNVLLCLILKASQLHLSSH